MGDQDAYPKVGRRESWLELVSQFLRMLGASV